MSQAAKPLFQPAGAPGNLQDVSDLREMLANSEALNEASRNHVAMLEATNALQKQAIEDRDDKIAKLEADKGELRNKLEEAEAELRTTTSRMRAAQNELSGTRDDFAEATEKEGFVDPQDIRDLCTARRLIKCGQTAEGVFELERALASLDPAWRTHA